MKLFYKEIKIGKLYIWLLIAYFFLSPFYFLIIYPGSSGGHNGIVQLAPLFVSFLTLFISLPVILVVKYIAEKRLLLGYTFLCFLFFSSLLGIFIFEGSSNELLHSLLISNFIGLLITCICIGKFSGK